MTRAFETFVSGLSSGSVYALAAVGFAFLFATGRFMNFAHGDWAMFSGMSAAAVAGAGTLVSAIIAPVVGAGVAVASYELVLKRSRARDMLTLSLALLGLGLGLQGLALWLWGAEPVGLSSISSLAPVHVGDAVVRGISLVVLIVAVVVLGLVTAFLRLTRTGRAMSAWAENPEAAAISGIPVERVSLVAFALAGALAGIAGFLLLGLTGLSYGSGFAITINAFGACAMGGFQSPARAAAGGVVLGLAEAIAGTYIGGNYTQVVALSLVFVVLIAVARRYKEEQDPELAFDAAADRAHL
jgi:branched-subunit amino acid ABC-type transport system permease component